MKLYHGSTLCIEHPDVRFSRSHLDFGKGFYCTSLRSQAENWALRKALRAGAAPIVTVYEMDKPIDELNILRFSDDRAWLDFVCSCRKGGSEYQSFDIVVGPVADDRVYDAVDLYYRGIWDASTTLEAIRFYQRSDQYCFVTQRAIDSLLAFSESYEVKHD